MLYSINPQLLSAVVAIVSAEMIFCSTLVAIGSQFTTGHCNEWTIVTFNDFQIANNKRMIKRDTTKPAQSIFCRFH
jgi:hypothetical protein